MQKILRSLAAAALLCASAAIAQAQTVAPFVPYKTTCATLTGSAQTVTLPLAAVPGSLVQMLVTNGSTAMIYWLADGTTVVTGAGTPGLASSQALFSVASSATTASLIGSATGGTVRFTSGTGE